MEHNSEYKCEFCKDRGVVQKDDGKLIKCLCVVTKELSIYIGDRYLNYRLIKHFDLDSLKGVSHAIGDFEYYNIFIKSFLFAYFFVNNNPSCWASITGNDISELYTTTNTQTQYYDKDVLFIDLSVTYSNKSIGDIIEYMIHYRETHNAFATFIYTGNLKLATLAAKTSPALVESLKEYKIIDLNNTLN